VSMEKLRVRGGRGFKGQQSKKCSREENFERGAATRYISYV
jgi:hypothetical protein